mgnify:CR=1 FL=1
MKTHYVLWQGSWKRYCRVGITSFFIALSSQAQESIELGTLEVQSGTPRGGMAVKQAADISQLKAREKEKSEGASLGDSLEALSGVENISTGPQTGKPVIRGLSGNRIRLLSDGMGVDHQQFGVRHTPNIESFLTDEFEVVKGASSLLYGSDALGGAVNVKSMKLDFSEESKFSGDTLFGFSSNNDQWDTGAKANWSGESWTSNVGVIFRDGGNITTPDEQTNVADRTDEPKFAGELDHTDFEQLNSSIGIGRRTDFGDFRLRLSRWDNEQNFLLPNGKALGQHLVNNQASLSGEIFAGAKWVWKPTLKYQNNIRKSNKPGNSRDELFDGNIDLEFDQYTARFEGEHGELLGLDGGTLGLEYLNKDQESSGRVQLSPGGSVNNFAVFAFEEKNFGPFLLQAGLRHDVRDVTAEESKTSSDDILFSGEEEKSFNETTGSVGGSYEFTENFIMATNIGRGFRAPTLFELYAKGKHGGVAASQRGEPELDAEKSLNTDVSLRWASQRSMVKLTGYRNHIDDYIFLEDTGQTTGGANSLPIFQHTQADAVLTGVELDAKWRLLSRFEVRLGGHLVDGENDDTGEELPLVPAHNVKLGATYEARDFSIFRSPYVGFDVRHVFSKSAAPREPFSQFDSKPFGSASTDEYTLLDINMGASFKSGNFMNDRLMRLDLRVRNVTDETYREFLDTYKGYALSPGRDFEVRLRIPFGG